MEKNIGLYKVFRRTTVHVVIPRDVFVEWVDWFYPLNNNVPYVGLPDERKCIERISHYHTYLNDDEVALPKVCLNDFEEMIKDYPWDSERTPRTFSLETNLLLPDWRTMRGNEVFPYRMARLRGPSVPLLEAAEGGHE